MHRLIIYSLHAHVSRLEDMERKEDLEAASSATVSQVQLVIAS